VDGLGAVFEYFPGNYAWSSAVNLALTAGGSIGDIHRWLEPLRQSGSTSAPAWSAAWSSMAYQQERLAADDLAAGHTSLAGRRFLRAAVYHATGQRLTPPGPAKSEAYAAMLTAFNHAVEFASIPLERIRVDSPDGPLPGYLIGPKSADTPVVVVFGGLDLTKEFMYAVLGDTFARHGISCLAIDTPGVGEPLRLRGVAARPDYEVSAAAIVDDLQTRDGVDATRIGVLGISLGGYYAARAAAFEPRISACVAWSGIWDWGDTWRRRWASEAGLPHPPWFQLPWLMGTATTEEALNRVADWTLAEVWPLVRQPLLIVHGENDQELPVSDARRAFAAAGSPDKQLRVFGREEGGAEHIQTDDPEPALELIADWVSARLAADPSQPDQRLALA
jgi:dienelactone hydrolase